MNDEKLLCCIMNKVRKNYVLTDIQEIQFFEYIVGMGANLKYDFNKSIKSIFEYTGIPRRAQERIAKKFSEMGFLRVGTGEYKGNPHRSYAVRFDNLSDPAVLGLIMKPGTELYERNIKFFSSLADKQLPIVTKEEASDKKAAEKLHERLCDHMVRRNKMYNDGELGVEPDKRLPLDTKLPMSRRVLAKLSAMIKMLGADSIVNAFVAFYDDKLKGNIKPKNLLEYFWVYDEEDGYKVANYYLNHFNADYSYKK